MQTGQILSLPEKKIEYHVFIFLLSQHLEQSFLATKVIELLCLPTLSPNSSSSSWFSSSLPDSLSIQLFRGYLAFGRRWLWLLDDRWRHEKERRPRLTLQSTPSTMPQNPVPVFTHVPSVFLELFPCIYWTWSSLPNILSVIVIYVAQMIQTNFITCLATTQIYEGLIFCWC